MTPPPKVPTTPPSPHPVRVAPAVAADPGRSVALETTLLLHGVPPEAALPLADELDEIVLAAGGIPATVGIIAGVPTVGLTRDQLKQLLKAHAQTPVAKANTANLGVLMHRGQHAATTVSATMEFAAAAGVRFFATGGIGGVHRGYGSALDISSDLAALARFPVGVVASGVKSILDVVATREALETLGVPVLGVGTDTFPAFYEPASAAGVDARFDDLAELAAFARAELSRSQRGLLLANPIPNADALNPEQLAAWIQEAEQNATAAGATGRGVTPAILSQLHQISAGATLQANLALVKSNCLVAATLAASS